MEHNPQYHKRKHTQGTKQLTMLEILIRYRVRVEPLATDFSHSVQTKPKKNHSKFEDQQGLPI